MNRSGLNYDKYYVDGQKNGSLLSNHLKKTYHLNKKRILAWGCGPGRSNQAFTGSGNR
jgi:hypothetical protein